jgi:biopolymer transport protein ExbB
MKRCILLFLTIAAAAAAAEPQSQLVDLKKVFTSAPIIYTVLSLLSIASMVIWLYSLATIRTKDILPEEFIRELKIQLRTGQFAEAEALCQTQQKFLSSIVSAGLSTRKLGAQVMIDSMKSEGKRAATTFWQRLSLLNDVVIIAPMLGLLGTVIGMFYAFYDVNRSAESINALFDGLGIAVGTTVAGLIVAIIAMIFYTTLKYRIVKTLAEVENEALVLSTMIVP